MNVGICVGHSRRGDSGAVALWGETEHAYNTKVAKHLQESLRRSGIESFVIDDYQNSGYSAGIRHAAKVLRDRGATLATELHFNSAGETANGAEWLYWVTSKGGEKLAEAFRASFRKAFPMMTDRGIKPRSEGTRGALFLRITPCPAIICEPFFGSNPKDCATFQGEEKRLAESYTDAIRSLS